jgi:hypothetical protein
MRLTALTEVTAVSPIVTNRAPTGYVETDNNRGQTTVTAVTTVSGAGFLWRADL